MLVTKIDIAESQGFIRFSSKVGKKAKIRNRYSRVPHLTQDTTWKSDKNTRKHHIQEGQEVSPFPADDIHLDSLKYKACCIKLDVLKSVFAHGYNNDLLFLVTFEHYEREGGGFVFAMHIIIFYMSFFMIYY